MENFSQIIKKENGCILKHLNPVSEFILACSKGVRIISQYSQKSVINDGWSSQCDCGSKKNINSFWGLSSSFQKISICNDSQPITLTLVGEISKHDITQSWQWSFNTQFYASISITRKKLCSELFLMFVKKQRTCLLAWSAQRVRTLWPESWCILFTSRSMHSKF